jgi:hypothetical protein
MMRPYNVILFSKGLLHFDGEYLILNSEYNGATLARMSLPIPDIEKLDGALKVWYLSLNKIPKDMRGALDLTSNEEREIGEKIILQQEGEDFTLITACNNGKNGLHLIHREVGQGEVNILFGLRELPKNLVANYRLLINLYDRKSPSRKRKSKRGGRGKRMEAHLPSLSEEEVKRLLPEIEEELKNILDEDFECRVNLTISPPEASEASGVSEASEARDKFPHCLITIHYRDLFSRNEELKDTCVKCRKRPRQHSYVCSQCIGGVDYDRYGEEANRMMKRSAFGPSDHDMPTYLYLREIPWDDKKNATVWMSLVHAEWTPRQDVSSSGYVFSFPPLCEEILKEPLIEHSKTLSCQGDALDR